MNTILKQRSKEKELIDLGSSFYSPNEYIDCLRILFTINKLLGFFKSTTRLLKRFPSDSSLIDIGCGGGLFLLNVSKCYPNMDLLGVDLSPTAIALANHESISWKQQNKRVKLAFQVQHQTALALPENSVDIVLATLVCHHIEDNDLIAFLQNTQHAAREAVILNDLHRHALAYWFYKKLSPLFRNRLITHDGLISIQRGFTRKEWQVLLQKANITNYRIKWGFPFRWSVVIWKK